MKKILFFIVFFAYLLSNAQQYSVEQIDSLNEIPIYTSDNRKAINLAWQTYKAAKQINYKKGQFEALSNISMCHSSLGNYYESIKYADKLEDEASEANDTYYIVIAYCNRSFSLSDLGFFEQSDDYMNKAYKLTSKLKGDQLYYARGLILQAKANTLYDQPSPIDSVLAYEKKSLHNYQKIKNVKIKNASSTILMSNIALSYLEKNTDSALVYAHKALKIAAPNGMQELHSFSNIAMAQLAKKNFDSTIYYANKVLKISKKTDPSMSKFAYESLAEAYDGLGNIEKFKFYNDKLNTLEDSLKISEKKNINKTAGNMLEEEKSESEKSKFLLYILIGISIIALIIVTMLAKNYFKNYKKEKQEKFSKEETILEKESKLTQLESKINDAFEEVLELAKNDDPAFLARFKEVYPEFYNKLTSTYPDLTISQLRFCAMLRLNFSTKEIAHYHHTTVRGVQTKKTRLRKQLHLPSEEDLNKWMMEF